MQIQLFGRQNLRMWSVKFSLPVFSAHGQACATQVSEQALCSGIFRARAGVWRSCSRRSQFGKQIRHHLAQFRQIVLGEIPHGSGFTVA